MRYVLILIGLAVVVSLIITARNLWLEISWKAHVEKDAVWIARYITEKDTNIADVIDRVMREQKYNFRHKDWRICRDGKYWVIGPVDYGKTIVIEWDRSIKWDG